MKCKNCGNNLTKFNKEICPYCGIKDPIDDYLDSSNTTQAIDKIYEEDKNFKQKDFKKYCFLLMFLGIFGIDSIYLGKIYNLVVRLICNVCFFLILFLSIYLSNDSLLVLSILLPIGILFLFYLIYGLIILFLDKKPKDKNGVYLK